VITSTAFGTVFGSTVSAGLRSRPRRLLTGGRALFYGRGDSLQELTDAGAGGPRPQFLRRPALERVLDAAFGKRLAVVTACAGFSKSTLLAGWVSDVEHAWFTLSLEGTAP
jgi:hypothetical protein